MLGKEQILKRSVKVVFESCPRVDPGKLGVGGGVSWAKLVGEMLFLSLDLVIQRGLGEH